MNHTYDTLNKALEQLKTALAQKEAENDALKAKVYEWKKRALAQEALNQQQIESHRERELQLIADHQTHIDALTSAHVDKMNSLSDNIICLQNAYEAQIAGANEPLTVPSHTTPATERQTQKTSELIGTMNDLMASMVARLDKCLQEQHEDTYEPDNADLVNTPPLSSPDHSYYDDENDFDRDLNDDDDLAGHATTPPINAAAVFDQSSAFYSTPVLSQQPSPHDDDAYPRLKSKPTMEHLTKVIPTFLKKKEQWKISHRRSLLFK